MNHRTRTRSWRSSITDLQRTTGESFGTPLARVNWGNYDLVVIDESHNFRNADPFKERDTRYDTLMKQVIRAGVKTKVLMLSATPVNNRFNDLKNQLALAYEGDAEAFRERVGVTREIEEIFRQSQKAFNAWSKLPCEERTTEAILDALDFDFFELLDSVTIARSRKHIQTFYDTSEIGAFPVGRNDGMQATWEALQIAILFQISQQVHAKVVEP